MTVATTAAAVIHQGNGVTKDWPFAFEIPKGEIKLTLVIGGVPLQPTDGSWSVTGYDKPSGGSVRYPVSTEAPALIADQYLIIERATPYTQTMNLVNQGNFHAESVEDGLDRIEFQIQQLKRLLDINNENFGRALRVPIPEQVVEFPVYQQRSLKFPFFDINGQPSLVDSGIENIVWSLANFENRAALAASRPNPAVSKVVYVGGYATYGDGGHGWYKYAPEGSTWPDGEVVDLDGKVWRLILTNGCLRAQQLGVVADAVQDGSAGTINNDALRRIVAAPATIVLFPYGGILFNETIRLRNGQSWIGMGGEKGPNTEPSSTEWQAAGTMFMYVGSGNQYAFETVPGEVWSESVMKGWSLQTGYTPDDPDPPDPAHPTPPPDLDGRDLAWLFNVYHGRNTYWEDISFRHRGGQRQLPAMAVGSFGCLRIQSTVPDERSWVHNFRKAEFLTGCNRRDSLGNTMLYNGYGWGLDCAGNDIYVTDSHFNGASMIGRNSGGWHISNTNFENGDWGSEPGFDGNPTGRAAICSITGSGKRGISGTITGGTISQYTYAFHTDSSANEGNVQCSIRVTGVGLRRNRLSEFRWVQNINNGASGGLIVNCGCTQKDEDEPEDLENPGLGKGSPIRHEIIHPDGSPADWPGLRVLNSTLYYPDIWDQIEELTAGWFPRFADGAGGDPVDPNDLIIDWRGSPVRWTGYNAVPGNPADPANYAQLAIPTRISPTKFGDGFSNISCVSLAGVGKAAEFWSHKSSAIRGDFGFGGFLERFRWGNMHAPPDPDPPLFTTADAGFVGIASYRTEMPLTKPSDFVQFVGVGFDPGETEWSLFSAGAVSVSADPGPGAGDQFTVKLPLGNRFPTQDPLAVYQLTIMATSGGKIWFIRIDRLDSPAATLQTTLKNNQGPASGQALYPHYWRFNGTNSNRTSIKLIYWRCYTQPTQGIGGSVFSGPQIWVP